MLLASSQTAGTASPRPPKREPLSRLPHHVQRSACLAEHRGLEVTDEEVFYAAPAIVQVGLAHSGRGAAKKPSDTV